jgi:hypothetical protein
MLEPATTWWRRLESLLGFEPPLPVTGVALPIAWQSLLRAVAAPYFLSRGLLFVTAWLALTLDPKMDSKVWHAFPTIPALDAWARWDSGWYASVALSGYYSAGGPANVNFFPLYPWLSLAVSWPLQGWLGRDAAFYLGGMVVSQLTFLLALAGIWQLASQTWGAAVARRSVWLVAFFGFSTFFSAVYTESLFLCLSVWAFVAAARDRWWTACGLASLCAVTRTVGGLVGIALALEYLWRHRGRFNRQALAAGLIPIPLLGMMAYWYHRFDHPLPFVLTQTTVWDKRVGISRLIDVLNSIRNPAEVLSVRVLNGLQFSAIALSLVLTVVLRRRLGPGLAGFGFLSALLVATTGFIGAGRYVSVLFPVFVSLALGLPAGSVRWVIAAQLPLLLYVTWDFAHGWWLT